MQELKFNGVTIKKHPKQHGSGRLQYSHGGIRFHCGMTPSRKLDRKVTAANPLLTKHMYQLHVYDHEAPAPLESKSLHPHHMHKENWNHAGAITFHGNETLTVAGHNIPEAKWIPAKSFSSNRVTALGGISDSSGQEITVAGTSLASYTTKRYKSGQSKDNATNWGTFTFGAQPVSATGPLETVDFQDAKPTVTSHATSIPTSVKVAAVPASAAKPTATVATATATATLQDLLHVSSLTTVTVSTPTPHEVVKDSAQEAADNAFQRILLGSLPSDTQKSFFPNITSMSLDGIAIQSKNSAFFNAAGVPYLAQYLVGSDSVSPDITSHINSDRISLFWKAVGSFEAPTSGSDPVTELGYDRKSQTWKDIQSQYAQQNMDTYQLELLYEWQTQMTCLQEAAAALGQKAAIDTEDVLAQLSSAILLPSFDGVNWTDEMKQQFYQATSNIMFYTKEDLDQIMKDNLEKYQMIMAVKAGITTYTSIDGFVSNGCCIPKHPGMAGDLWQIQEQYQNAFITAGDDIKNEKFINIVGEAYIEECAQELAPQASRWRQWAASAKNFGANVTAAVTPLLYAVGVAGIIYSLVKDHSQLSPLNIIQLTGIALELSIKTLSSIAATRLGVWIQENFLNRNGITKPLGEWFTEAGVAVVEDSSILSKLLGASSAEFLVNHLGPALSLIAVGISIESLVRAIRDGTRTDVIYSSINLALAVIDIVVVFIGIAASAAEAGSALAAAGAFCGPIGIGILTTYPTIAVVGIIVAVISFFVHDQPKVPNPPEDFVSGPLKQWGYYK
ncbi:hypothetical protein L218DRAFT_1059892 [Marasmius fiardii PR-910]|nr:hypothetical protein L218DRAFT_1059892 [Marasmius fiardii PR-910]